MIYKIWKFSSAYEYVGNFVIGGDSMVNNLQWNRHYRHDSKIIYFYKFLLELFPFNAGKRVQFHLNLKFEEN